MKTMALRRISKQGSETLEEYFDGLYSVNESFNFVDNIQFVIRSLHDICVSTNVWALTSMHQLVLLNKDDWKSDWLITISANQQTIFIAYIDPETKEKQIIETDRENVESNLLYAMRQTEGWFIH